MKLYKNLKSDLFTFKSEKLTKISIFFVIVLDIFLFSTVMSGIDSEQEKLVKVLNKYPYSCRSESVNKVESLYYVGYISKNSDQDSRCAKISKYLSDIKNNKEFKENNTTKIRLTRELKSLRSSIKRAGDRYNTSLFDNIAENPSLKKEIARTRPSLKGNYDKLIKKEKELKRSLAEIPKLQDSKIYKDYVNYKNANIDSIKNDYASYKKTYELKSYLYLLKFVLPLLLLFGYIYISNKSKQLKGVNFNNIMLVISSHLLIILAIPVIWGVFTTLWSLIPKLLLSKIINLLVSFGALFLGFYGIIVLAILVVFGIVYYLQRNSHKKHRIYSVFKKSIAKSVCYNCKCKVDYANDKFCGFCKEEILQDCKSCNKQKIKVAQYCRHCGTE